MAPSEHTQPKMLLKSPSKPSLPGLSKAKMSKANLLALGTAASKTSKTPGTLLGDSRPDGPLSRAKSRVQLVAEPKEAGGQMAPMSRVKSRIQMMEMKIVGDQQLVSHGLSRAKSRVQLPKKEASLIPKETAALARNKSKTQLTSKKEVPKKTLVKSKSRAVLKDKNDPVATITDEALDIRNKQKLDKDELTARENIDQEEHLDKTVTAVVLDHSYSSPSSKSPTPPKLDERVRSRIAFSDVSVFYFDRTVACCSVPKNGAHTLGMEVRHNHFERRLLTGDEDDSPHVRRKLFSIAAALEEEDEALEALEALEWSGAEWSGQHPTWCSQPTIQEQRQYRVSTDMEPEISQNDLKPGANAESSQGPKGAFSEYRTEPEPTTESKHGPFATYNDYRVAPSTDNSDTEEPSEVSETPKARVQSAVAFKRSLSRTSEDFTPFTRERKPSLTHGLLAKLPKTEGIEDTPTTSKPMSRARSRVLIVVEPKEAEIEETPTTSRLPAQKLMKTRSSSRINGNKALQSYTNNNGDDKPKPMLTPKSLKGSKRLSKAFTTTNLKVQSSASLTPGDLLPKPNQKLTSSITTSCLKSFQNFHESPESKAVEFEISEDNDLPVPRPKFARSNSKKLPLQRPPPEEVSLQRGSSVSKKKPKKKGASGTRGMTPLAERARVSLLRSHGVQVLQGRAEQEELELLRESREKCGCSCVGDCEPETCECALNGIECQVERDGFPCACGPACANPEGRREFDETEVSLHYINTMMTARGVMDLMASSQESLTSIDIGTF